MCKDIAELLPFYVNGTLKDAERKTVETALENDPSLTKEVEFLEKLRREIKAQPFENSPGELGLKRLHKSIAEDKIKNDLIARAQSKITREQNWGWRVAAIAACLLLMLQTIVTFPMWQGDNLSAAGGKTVIQANGQIVSVTFVPQAKEENIRNLLLSIDATIVDGPSALGVYKLSISKDARAALEKLRAHKTLVETANIDGRQAGQ